MSRRVIVFGVLFFLIVLGKVWQAAGWPILFG